MRFRHLAVVLVAAVCTACGASLPNASQREPLPAAASDPALPQATAKAGSGELCKAIEKLDPQAAMEHVKQGPAGMKKAADTFDDLATVAPADVGADLRQIADVYRKLADGQMDPAAAGEKVGPLWQEYLTYVTKHCVGG
ncbi:hypothetical protein [Nonomuraea sediminis]|uniref:hypothetical protein n=1 Tax=Nonomuraea sediminis TaxID=2835864 RepID=UPI001BDD7FB3|nr:hypothetical protein [Nonomuraea sediminis]